ncbi:secreted RxLR effector protein 161-like [Salvia splendens]|uniref:secreted RxLR effector protein 161-like n=1 Tax=Salvia splendens TaxID=180675 RepID=UPI001C27E05F|nr:secreted RxLR effector protein 161-like [Salvia splendens]
MNIGFEKSAYDSCVYIKSENGKAVAYLVLYVDDMLVGATNLVEIGTIKQELQKEFEMKDLGEAQGILGMDIRRDRRQPIKLSLEQLPKTETERLDVQDIPYANIIGSTMYCMICTRPDLAHGISVTSRYMREFGKDQWMALKWILRYTSGTKNIGILFKQQESSENPLLGYCDSDYATNLDTRKSQTGYIFMLNNSAVGWKSTLQSVVALSTTEASTLHSLKLSRKKSG